MSLSARVRPPRASGALRLLGRRLLVDPLFRDAAEVYRATEGLSTEALGQVQAEWLKTTLDEAYRSSPFYRRRLGDAGWPGLDRARLDRVPPLRRDELVRHAHDIAVPGGGGAHRSSGGSGGAPVLIPVDRGTYAWYLAGTWRGFRWWGLDPADPVCLLLGRSTGAGPLAVLSRAKDWLLNWRRVPVDDRFDELASEVLDAVARYAPRALYGYPSAIHRLARAARTGRARLRLSVVVLTGEPLYAFQRREISETFGCPVAEEYGSGELGSVAFECPHGGLHVNAEAVLLETVPVDGVRESAVGRVLATHLRNRRFPLIRYETGDIAALASGGCGCGRGLPTLRVLGRERDRLVGDGTAGFARARVDTLMSLLPAHLGGGVQVTQPAADAVVLRLSRTQARPEDLAHALAAGAEAFGPGWRVEAEEVDRLARIPSGKLPYFVGLAG